MARQMQIPGTQRKEVPEVEKAGEMYREIRDERRELKDRETARKLELIAVMRAHKVKVYKWKDQDGSEIRVELADGEAKIKLAKVAEAEREVGAGGGFANRSEAPDVHKGLVDQAMKSQEDDGVTVDSEGDVVPPEKSAPRKVRRKKGK